MFEQAQKELKKRKEPFKVIDLYKDKFNPVYYLDKPDKLTLKYQKLIKESDKLLFIYPVWWFMMPAILKGFFDKVFEAGFAFKYVDKMPKGLLKDKKAAVLLTTGAPAVLYLLSLSVPSRLISLGILKFCGIKNKVFSVHSCLKFSRKKQPELRAKVKNALDYLI